MQLYEQWLITSLRVLTQCLYSFSLSARASQSKRGQLFGLLEVYAGGGRVGSLAAIVPPLYYSGSGPNLNAID